MQFNYAAFRAEYVRLASMTSYERANDKAVRAKQRKAAAVSDWWQCVEWLDWLDDPGTVSRPTERMCMIRMSPSVRRKLEGDVRWWTIQALRYAYGQQHDMPLAALLNKRGVALTFVEVGQKGSKHYKAVEVAA